MVIIIKIQRTSISTKAITGERRAKKSIDQRKLNTSWAIKKLRAFFTAFFSKPFIQTIYAAAPIKK